jgi:O-antigen/teichoic acid export membrane protein
MALFDQALYSGATFATSWIIKHWSSTKELGLFALAWSLVMLVRNIQEQLIAIPYRVYCHRERPHELSSYTASVFIHQLCLSAIAMIALPLCFAGLGTGLSSPAILCVVVALPFFLSRESVRFITFSKAEIPAALIFDLFVCGVQVALLVSLGQTHRLTAATAFLAMATSCGTATCIWLFWQRGAFRLVPSRIVPDWRRNWVLAKWALLATIAAVLYPCVSLWMLHRWHEDQVGIFAACVTMAGVPQMFIMGMSNWASPQYARAYAFGGVRAMQRAMLRTLLVFFVFIGGFAVLTALAGNWIMIRVWGTDFAGSGPVLMLLALSMIAHAVSNVTANGLWAMELPRAHVKADVTMLLTTAVVAFLLVGPLGPLGAAWASLSGAILGATVRAVSLWLNMARVSALPLGGVP